MRKIVIKGGNVKSLDRFFNSLAGLEDGEYNVFIEKAGVGKAKYFYYRDLIARELGYGSVSEKKQLHDQMKTELLLEVFKNPANLNTEDYENLTLSTKHLSEEGWHNLNRSVELWAASGFNIVLK